LRKSPMTSLRKGMTYLYKGNQSPESRQLSRSRERSQTRSRSTSSEKEMDDRDRDHSWMSSREKILRLRFFAVA
jgi:hypothetical protein